MGRMVIDAIAAAPGMVLGAATERRDSPDIGQVIDGVTIGADFAASLAGADVYIDFTAPEATAAHVAAATGLPAEARAALIHAGASIPIVVSPNFSLGINLLCGLVEQAARALGDEFDLEVVEVHHRAKRDAPSGTAIAIAEAMARGRGLDFPTARRFAREGDVGPRPTGEIGVVALRGGDVVGEHTAHFLGPNERIEVTHRAASRAVFARGAVKAAAWVVKQPPGVYSMRDVLGL
jgi:4-hydroxy-tetrahydrodipicolinate reductase